MFQVTFHIHLRTHLHERDITASEHSTCSLSASSVGQGLMLISSPHTQKVLSYSSRPELTQPLSLVLRSMRITARVQPVIQGCNQSSQSQQAAPYHYIFPSTV